MNILAEIYRSAGVNVQGKIIHRTAVRGVILRGTDLLMIFSSHVGDYKFPGGGVVTGETHAQALRREVQEECGTCVAHLGQGIGIVIEYDFPEEKDYDTFKMTSYYYRCEVENGFGVQKLDGYEQDLGFQPVWIDIDQAVQRNKALLRSNKPPVWLGREIFVLEHLKQAQHL